MDAVEKIHAFEPVKHNYAQMMANLYLNGLTSKVEAHRLALSDAAGESTIHIYPGSAGMARLDKDSAGKKTDKFTQAEVIEKRRLDDMLPLSGQRFFAKIDVEGHAPEVLAGMEQFLANNKGVLQIECLGDEEPKVEAFMERMGYRYFDKVLFDRYYTNCA